MSESMLQPVPMKWALLKKFEYAISHGEAGLKEFRILLEENSGIATQRNRSGHTLAHAVANASYTTATKDFFRLLRDSGADLNVRDGLGESAIKRAIRERHFRTAWVLWNVQKEPMPEDKAASMAVRVLMTYDSVKDSLPTITQQDLPFSAAAVTTPAKFEKWLGEMAEFEAINALRGKQAERGGHD